MVLKKTAGLIARRGSKDWSTAELTGECGLAKNALYKIIKTKEQLIETIVIKQIDATIGLTTDIIKREDDYKSAALRMIETGPFFFRKDTERRIPENWILMRVRPYIAS